MDEPVRQSLWNQMDVEKNAHVSFGDFVEWVDKHGGEGDVAEALVDRSMGHRFSKMTWIFQGHPLIVAWKEASVTDLQRSINATVDLIKRHLSFKDEKEVSDMLAPLLPVSIQWNMAPVPTWSRLLEQEGYTRQRHVQAPWRGFHRGTQRVHILMRWECHDKRALFELLRQQTADAPIGKFLLETCLSVEEHVGRSQLRVPKAALPMDASEHAVRQPDNLWYLKLSNVRISMSCAASCATSPVS
jgi:hypothetical protein